MLPQRPALAVMISVVGLAEEAEQLALVPPLLPWQLQDHGPAPLKIEGDALPTEQSPDGGVVVTVPLDGPQTPFTGAAGVVAETLEDCADALPTASYALTE